MRIVRPSVAPLELEEGHVPPQDGQPPAALQDMLLTPGTRSSRLLRLAQALVAACTCTLGALTREAKPPYTYLLVCSIFGLCICLLMLGLEMYAALVKRRLRNLRAIRRIAALDLVTTILAVTGVGASSAVVFFSVPRPDKLIGAAVVSGFLGWLLLMPSLMINLWMSFG